MHKPHIHVEMGGFILMGKTIPNGQTQAIWSEYVLLWGRKCHGYRFRGLLATLQHLSCVSLRIHPPTERGFSSLGIGLDAKNPYCSCTQPAFPSAF